MVFPPGPDAGAKTDAPAFQRDAMSFTSRDASTTKRDSSGFARDTAPTFFRRD